MTAALDSATALSIESLRAYLAASDFTDRAKWVGACDRVLGRFVAEDDALRALANPGARPRHLWGHGELKARVARLAPGETLPMPTYSQACSFRAVAKDAGRRARVRTRYKPDGRREITITMLD